ncbi:DUF1232 domain-containing protein [Desertifilum sp. FACHB-1129]|uniref:DUF1232 domain-containing protein n=2 Tax=Desertifilum tharense IPPAS B-1220 TaxID=1781255 RepID=A0A1E5QGJ6_9CYAN|nr:MULTISPECIES: YkvA family protein [Desertifilum]MCD8487837.1 DUF1232 domain-containing protein [Desertifilum sp.]MDA0208629.1 YkvA family protein [Cyanobacteria bacterium FC1]MDI9634245.1 YkvA family protein [Geitlerinema splendidum]MBD2314827.1 DUF1232 domain-containing protein [Desertifilum sp. FACHB-1129]MBD2321233.1 DUF1232 domain-containing protein [Desertifilum sp. FACHB-866]
MNNSIQSVYNWYRNTIRNSKYRWWVILGTLAYILSPFDISPDFLPIVGQIDDVVLLTLLITEVSQMLIEYTQNRQAEKDAKKVSTAGATNATVDVDSVSVK